MPSTAKRTSRACERCRQTRRRCEPPYPCRPCVAAGTSCDVRAKARPQRRRQCRQTSTTLHENDLRTNKRCGDALTCPRTGQVDERSDDRRLQEDTFELLRRLVQDILLSRYDYAFDCTLKEPLSCKAGEPDSLAASLAESDFSPPPPLNSLRVRNLLTGFRNFMSWQDAKLIDFEDLDIIARAHMEHISSLNPSEVSTTAIVHRLPVDSISLICAALAIGAVGIGELGQGRYYFGISTEVIKHFVGRPTIKLCLAFFLQHVFALRVGTSNYARGIVAQAIQNAHDLGLHHNSHGIPGLQLYLLIYMADQYCSLTHNTEPIIRASQLKGQIFAPLSEAEPQLQTLIDLVMINGSIIEHSHQHPSPLVDEIAQIEARIGTLCSRQVAAGPMQPLCGGMRAAYEPLARVHMLCCRLKLRAPGLSKQISWLSSLCICVHAAEGILATYFQLYQPVLIALSRQGNVKGTAANPLSTLASCKLAVTWRQVKRIMMSSFVIVFAYWHGEMIHGEAARYVAMARLLLEYPRWRWGKKLDEALRTLVDISSLGEFSMYEHMQMLLPAADQEFLRSLCSTHDLQSEPRSDTCSIPKDQTAVQNQESSSTPILWPDIPDPVSMNDLSGSGMGATEYRAFFDLWDPFELPIEGRSWTA